MSDGPAGELWSDIARGAKVLAVAAAAGAVVGAGLAALRPRAFTSSATFLAAARSPDPDGFRRKPVSLDELRAHLDVGLLDGAAASAALAPGSLAGAVELAARSESGLYDVTVAQADGATARRAADALLAALCARLNDLRARKVAEQLAGLRADGAAAAERERAEAAYLADVGAGAVEEAEAQLARGAPEAARPLASARANRERLRLAVDRARDVERAEQDSLGRARAAALAFEPRAEPFAAAAEPVERPRRLVRAAGTGAGAAAVLVLALLAILGGARPRRGAGGAGAPAVLGSGADAGGTAGEAVGREVGGAGGTADEAGGREASSGGGARAASP